MSLSLSEAHQVSMVYDATLRVVQSRNSDGKFDRNEFEPLVVREFDENDNDSGSPHFNTPQVLFNDGLGRLVRADEIVRLNDDGTPTPTLQTWTTLRRSSVTIVR